MTDDPAHNDRYVTILAECAGVDEETVKAVLDATIPAIQRLRDETKEADN